MAVLFAMGFLLWLNSLSFYLERHCWTHHYVGNTEMIKEKDVSIKT